MEKLTQNSDIRKWFKRYKFHVTAEKLEVVTGEDSTAEQVEEARQKNLATLIDHLDHEIYDILEDQCYPETVESRTTAQVQKVLEDFLDPKPSKHWQRYVFDKLYQKEGQSVKEFIKEIRRTGALCEFGNYSNDAMLTKMLSGLKNEKLVSEMLGDPDVTWESAQAKALSTEKTLEEAQKMKSSSGIKTRVVEQANRVGWKQKSGSKREKKEKTNSGDVSCSKCTLKGHSADNCTTKCFNCKKKGHIKTNCWKRQGHSKKGSHNGDRKSHHVAEETSDDDLEENLGNMTPAAMYYAELQASEFEYESECSAVVEYGLSDLELEIERDWKIVCEEMQEILNDSGKCSNDFTFLFENCKDFDLTFALENVGDDFKLTDELFSNYVSLHDEVYETIDLLSNDHNHTTHNHQRFDDVKLHNDQFRIVSNVHALDIRPVVECSVNDTKIEMEFDTGSSVSVVSEATLKACNLHLTLIPSRRSLRVANGQIKPIKGSAVVDVAVKEKLRSGLTLYVVEGYFPSLFGRDWINRFCGEHWLEDALGVKTQVCNPVSSVVSAVSQINDKSTVAFSRSDLSGGRDLSQPRSRKDLLGVRDLSQPRSRKDSSGVGDLSQPRSRKDSSGGRDLSQPQSRKDLSGVKDLSQPRSCKDPVVRQIEELMKSEIFDPGLGLAKGIEACLVLKDDAKPVMLKARTIPYALKEKVEKQLDAMEEAGILTKIDDCEWGTPVVPVKKGDSVRICGDYKSTLNKCLSTRQYPIPSVEECFNTVAGGVIFSVLDIKQGYNNLQLREEDKKLTTINTHKGLYQWERLPYGISSSAAIFQGVMDEQIRDIPLTTCRIDDILVSGRTREEHLVNLNKVVSRLEKSGLRCNQEKSQIAQASVKYLGHQISSEGIRPLKSKVESLMKAPVPSDVSSLVSFLSGVGYYRKYLPNLSSVIAPLDRLRQKDQKWRWTQEEQEAFDSLKKMLCSEQVLTLYDSKLPVKLDTDASGQGLGAVLSHVFPDGQERPIEFISRTLSKAERNYSQIDREALAIVWAVKRFHIYLYGRKFTLVTDHKALTHIFNVNRAIPEMSAARITRWSIFLMNYEYDILFRPTKKHCNADMLSRLPKSVSHAQEEEECEAIFSLALEETLLNGETVARETRKDAVLSKVLGHIQNGWPDTLQCEGEMQALWSRRNELSVENNCITWGDRVVIPRKLRDYVLQTLHSTHVGIVGMKSLARSYVWWHKLDADIEEITRKCAACNKYGKSLPKLLDHPWTRPSGPFQRVHIDFCGPFKHSMWLVMQDAYSKWPEVIRMNNNITSPATIKALRLIFARTGIPMTLVSDNGPSLVSYEMKNFLKRNGIKHIPIPTYSSKSNGICERFVGTFKAAIKKMCETDSDVDKNVANFLLTYRNTPHSSTGEAPAVRAFNRNLRFCLTQIRPTDSQKVKDLQPEQESKVMMKNERSFEPKQPVYVQLDMDKTWTPAVIKQRHGSNSNVYDIECNGRVIKKHGDKLKARDMSISVTKKQMQPEEVELMRRQLAAKESEQSSGTSSGTSEPIETKSIPSPAQVSMPESRPSRAAKTDALAKIKSAFQR